MDNGIVARFTRAVPPCPSCAAKDARIRELEEFRCRTNEAFITIQNDINYSQKVKLETAIYGSYSCSHETENARLRELEEENAGLKEKVEQEKIEGRRMAERALSSTVRGREWIAEYATLRARCERLEKAAKILLSDSEYFSRKRCSDVGDEYGKGTDAEDAMRTALCARKEG